MNGSMKKAVVYGIIYGIVLSAGAFFFVEKKALFVFGVWGGVGAALLNLALLRIAVPMFTDKKKVPAAVAIYLVRLAIYGLGILISVKAGNSSAIGFAFGALGLIPVLTALRVSK